LSRLADNDAIGVGSMLTVSRGLSVLQAFQSRMDPLGNSEIVRRTGIPKAAVSRITSTLIQLGYLKRVPGSRLFQLGIMPLAVGQAYLDAAKIIKAVEPFMQPLADELSTTTALALPYDLDMLYVAYFKSPKISTLTMGLGSVLPMAQTSVGYTHLWSLTPQAREAMFERIRARDGIKAKSRIKRIKQAITSIDENGYCMAISDWQPDVYGTSVPVRLGVSRTMMSFSCGAVLHGVNEDFIRKKIIPRLKSVAIDMQKATAALDFEP